MLRTLTRREFARRWGLAVGTLPFLLQLPSLGFAQSPRACQRLVIVFSPNGTVPSRYWPDQEGEDFQFKEILEPLAPFRSRTLTLQGVHDKIRGDGDAHMRGMGCLLTGGELFPGNIQGGSETPAGWAKGMSIDQALRAFLQDQEETKTRFGSLEFGVAVPNKADTWTRMVYAAGNRPIAPIDDPYRMFDKLYGRRKDAESLRSVLDELQEDLRRAAAAASPEDRRLLDEHLTMVRQTEQELSAADAGAEDHPEPQLEPGVRNIHKNIPQLSKMQIDLMVNAFAGDFARIATLQFTNSVGQAQMSWLGFEERHHDLSHEPDSNEAAQSKLTKINRWYCEQVAYLASRLATTPEPGGDGMMLDHTTILWCNELGQGNSHTLDNIPFTIVGGGLGFKTGRALRFDVPHNRLLLSLAHGFGHMLTTFGHPDFCGDGPLTGLS